MAHFISNLKHAAIINARNKLSIPVVQMHCQGHGFDSQQMHEPLKHCKSLWINASGKCMNVNEP